MFRRITRRRLEAFQRTWDYDTEYMRWMLDTSPRAFWRYARFLELSRFREDAPSALWHTARLTSVLAGDCGPCVQLLVRMAESAGVDPAQIKAVLESDENAMQEEVALGWRFARAVLAHAPEADQLRERIAAAWGPRAVLSTALAVATANLFPTLKYGLGHGHTCVRVRVAGSDVDAPPLESRIGV